METSFFAGLAVVFLCSLPPPSRHRDFRENLPYQLRSDKYHTEETHRFSNVIQRPISPFFYGLLDHDEISVDG
jgi:hypothetical protein